MALDLSPPELGKFISAYKALDFIESGMKLGLGTGSTAAWLVKLLAYEINNNGLVISACATSSETTKLAESLGIKISQLDELGQLDLAIDGADEFDQNLNLIKGGGAALLQEKIVETAADKLVIITDASKQVNDLGAFDLPVEVVKFGWETTKRLIENVLIDQHLTARDYVIYRESRRQARVEKEALSPESQAAAGAINVVGADGNAKPLDIERIRTIVAEACMDLSDVSEAAIIDEALKNLYDGVTEHELSTSLVITARTMIEQEPNYSSAAARLLLDNLRAEGLSFLNVADSATQSDMETYYPQALKAFISRGIELELLAPNLVHYSYRMLPMS